jgi:hypothetical protein
MHSHGNPKPPRGEMTALQHCKSARAGPTNSRREVLAVGRD